MVFARRRVAKRTRPRKVGKKIKRTIQRTISSYLQTKWHDYTQTEMACPITGNSHLLTAIGQGDAATQRDGAVVFVTKIEIWLTAYIRPVIVSQDATNCLRFILFKWKPDTASDAYLSGDLVQDPTNLPFNSPYNMVNKNQSVVLRDKRITCNYTGPNEKAFKIVKKFKGRGSKIIYNIGSNEGRGIFFLQTFSDSSLVDHPVYTFYARITFRNA